MSPTRIGPAMASAGAALALALAASPPCLAQPATRRRNAAERATRDNRRRRETYRFEENP